MKSRRLPLGLLALRTSCVLLLAACSRATAPVSPLPATNAVPTAAAVPLSTATSQPPTTAPAPTLTPVPASPTVMATLAPTPQPLPPTTSPTLPHRPTTRLAQALAGLPAEATYVTFTDWALIKAREGATGSTTTTSKEWLQFWLTALQSYGLPSCYACRNLGEHAATWGWDSADLDWEVSAMASLPPSHVLKFRDDFDFAPVVAHFAERGFSVHDYHGVPVYTHTLSIDLEWLRQTEFSILNTAVVTEAHMLLMSIGTDIVHAMIDVYQGQALALVDTPGMPATLETLGEVTGAFVSADACAIFSSEALLKRSLPFSVDELKAQLRDRPLLHSYRVLGIGYRYKGADPSGLIVMDFATPEQAQADLPARRQLASEGLVQSKSPETYSAFFALSNAGVEANRIVFSVQPVDDRPGFLFDMPMMGDLTFATCP